MDILTQLFNYIPEKWRPVVATLLLIILVITKARSMRKTHKINQLQASAVPTTVTTSSSPIGIITSQPPTTFTANLSKVEQPPKKPTLLSTILDNKIVDLFL